MGRWGMSRGCLLALVASLGACVGEKLIFHDNFTTFNLNTWEHEITMSGEGNWEFEYYTNNRSNSFVKDGVLYLKPTYTADTIGPGNVLGNDFTLSLYGLEPADRCTGPAFNGCQRSNRGGHAINPIQSARIRTAKAFTTKYGRVEVVAKLPRGDWIWPALWMMPRYNEYGSWPASGEIDFMEGYGNNNTGISSTLHWGPSWKYDAWAQTHAVNPEGNMLRQGFHKYIMEWTPMGIQTYVGPVNGPYTLMLNVSTTGKSFWEKGGWGDSLNNPWAGAPDNAPFDKEFYLIFNVAVGGTNGYFPDNNKAFPNKPWKNDDPHAAGSFWKNRFLWQDSWKGDDVAMQIDSVSVFDTTGDRPFAANPHSPTDQSVKEQMFKHLRSLRSILTQKEYEDLQLRLLAQP